MCSERSEAIVRAWKRHRCVGNWCIDSGTNLGKVGRKMREVLNVFMSKRCNAAVVQRDLRHQLRELVVETISQCGVVRLRREEIAQHSEPLALGSWCLSYLFIQALTFSLYSGNLWKNFA